VVDWADPKHPKHPILSAVVNNWGHGEGAARRQAHRRRVHRRVCWQRALVVAAPRRASAAAQVARPQLRGHDEGKVGEHAQIAVSAVRRRATAACRARARKADASRLGGHRLWLLLPAICLVLRRREGSSAAELSTLIPLFVLSLFLFVMSPASASRYVMPQILFGIVLTTKYLLRTPELLVHKT